MHKSLELPHLYEGVGGHMSPPLYINFIMYPNQSHAESVPYQLLGLKVKFWLNGGHLKNPTEIPQKFQKKI